MGNYMEIRIKQLRVDIKAREWCLLPYPDHPHGCPNYGKRDTCPPDAPLVDRFIDTQQPMYLIVVSFDLEQHIHRMMQIHPQWSERQAKCVLYWQAGVNHQLDNECKLFKWSHPAMITTRCPEAMGVNVIATAQLVGIPIKVKPKDMVYKIALAGVPV